MSPATARRAAARLTDFGPAPGAHDARERLQRALYFACGVGAVVFGLLLVSGSSGILAARGQVTEVFWWTTLLLAAGVPATYLVTAFVAPMRLLHTIAIVCVVGFPVVQVLWIPAMHGEVLEGSGAPWLQGINALPSTLAGVVIASRAVWVFPASQLVLVPLVQLAVSDRSPMDAFLDGCGAVIFCSILTGMALAIVESGDRLDEASQQARAVASQRAVAHTRERELARINAIVHDDVMSVLLAASRVGATDAVRAQARQAQEAIAQITDSPHSHERSYEAAEFVAVVRGLASSSDLATGAKAAFTEDSQDSPPLPGDAVAAITEATGEALRNCAQHAGPEATVAVHVKMRPEGTLVVIHDDGIGFDPGDVDPRRLGIAVSIAERMRSVPGGRSMLQSRPGHGTTIELTWRRP